MASKHNPVMETLTYYHNYKIFPSDYVKNKVVTPVLGPEDKRSSALETEISILHIWWRNAHSEVGLSEYLTEQPNISHSQLNRTRFKKVFKNKKNHYSHSKLMQRFGEKTKNELLNIHRLLKEEVYEYYRDYAWGIILPIPSEHPIYQEHWGEDFRRYVSIFIALSTNKLLPSW